jgi:hypothetical protein
MTRDYSVTIKVKNNRLLEKMQSAGYESAAALSRDSGAPKAAIGLYLNLKKAPLLKGGTWSETVLRLAKFLRCLPEDLFPKAHTRDPLAKNVSEFKADATDIYQISSSLRSMALPSDEKMMIAQSKASLYELLKTLNPTEREVIEGRFGLVDGEDKSLRVVGENLSEGARTVERIRQLEARALRKLRRRILHSGLTGHSVMA